VTSRRRFRAVTVAKSFAEVGQVRSLVEVRRTTGHPLEHGGPGRSRLERVSERLVKPVRVQPQST